MKNTLAILAAMLALVSWSAMGAFNPQVIDVDVDIDGIADPSHTCTAEVNPGGFVAVGGEKKKITLTSTVGTGASNPKVRLSWETDRIELFDNLGAVVVPDGPIGGTTVYKDYAANTTFDLFVTGTVASASAQDVPITLEALHSTPSVSDTVRFTVLKVDFVTTDITGFHGIGSTAAACVPRIPLSQEPDGIACDGSDGVGDGARLLVRVLITNTLDAATIASLSVDWGYINGSGTFATLPTSPKQEGEYMTPTSADEMALTGLGIGIVGQPYEIGSDRKVLAAQIHKPPVEFDLGTPSNTAKERKLRLAADVKLSTAPFCQPETNFTLVKPPVVMVHGINSGPGKFTGGILSSGMKGDFQNNRGFVCETADYSAPAAPTYDGNGDLHVVYTYLTNAITDVTGKFRNGTYYSGKKIAVQKCDIVAHSYGGLVSRWYVERAGPSDDRSVFDGRRDVRKLITMGTPHRGSPLGNMSCETYVNPVFRDANTHAWSLLVVIPPTMGGLLDALDHNPLMNTLVKVRWHDGVVPPSGGEGDDTHIVPSLEVLCVGSDILNKLNREPFNDDVAYGTVVGDNASIGGFNGFTWVEPFYDSLGFDTKSYFPWFSGLDGGSSQSDAIVPAWSQAWGDTAWQFNKHLDHLAYPDDSDVRDKVASWLVNRELPLGSVERGLFQFITPGIPNTTSRANAYRGSTMIPALGNLSRNGGVYPNAIVQCQFVRGYLDTDLTQGGTAVYVPVDHGDIRLGSKGGILAVKCTGMVADSLRYVQVVRDGGLLSNTPLDTPVSVPYAGSGELKTFSVLGKIGRTRTGGVIGNIGQKLPLLPWGDNSWDVGYTMSGSSYFSWTRLQSPPCRIVFPAYSLPAPAGPAQVDTAGGGFTISGGATVSSSPGWMQVVDATLWANTATPIQLVNLPPVVTIPADAFMDVLIPYSYTNILFKDSWGYVAGAENSSGQSSVSIFQRLVEPGNTKDSSGVVVSVVP